MGIKSVMENRTGMDKINHEVHIQICIIIERVHHLYSELLRKCSYMVCMAALLPLLYRQGKLVCNIIIIFTAY